MATIALTATVQPANWPPRVKIDVTDTGTPAINSVTVTRVDPAGNTSVVRTPTGGPLQLVTSGSTRVGTVYDYEVPYGVPVTYSTSERPAVVTPQRTVPETRVWLVHPGVPDRSVPVIVAGLSERVRTVTRGVHRPMDRKNPIVITDGRRHSAEQTITVRTVSDSGRAAMDALLDDATVLLLNIPATKQWGMDACYIAVGDVTESRLVPWGQQPMRHWLLPFVVVDAPAGGSQSQWTWADVMATYSTWAQLIAANPTWADLQTPKT